MSGLLQLFIKAIQSNETLNLTADQHKKYDMYTDMLIAEGKIIKHSQYDFTGEGLAIIINEELEKLGSKQRIIALQTDDPRIYTKVKGQGVYFLIENCPSDENMAILTFGYNCLTFWPGK